jgi:hypothetical protein
LKNAQRKISFELQIVKLKEGNKEFNAYKDRFPVIFIDKEFAFQYKVPEMEFISKLEQAHAGQ